MNHRDVRDRQRRYLDGELPLAQRALVDAHMDQCEACAQELRQLQATIRLLRGMPSPQVPAGLATRVLAQIESGEGRPRWFDGLWPAAGARSWTALAGPAVATAAIAAVAMLLLVRVELPTSLEATVRPATERRVAQRAVPLPRRELSELPTVSALEPGPAPTLADLLGAQRAPAPRRVGGLLSAAATRPGPAEDRFSGELSVWRPRGETSALLHSTPTPRVVAVPALQAEIEQALLRIRREPAAFVEELAARSVFAREAWLAELARAAAQRGVALELGAALRSTGDPRAILWAARFQRAAAQASPPR